MALALLWRARGQPSDLGSICRQGWFIFCRWLYGRGVRRNGLVLNTQKWGVCVLAWEWDGVRVKICFWVGGRKMSHGCCFKEEPWFRTAAVPRARKGGETHNICGKYTVILRGVSYHFLWPQDPLAGTKPITAAEIRSLFKELSSLGQSCQDWIWINIKMGIGRKESQ